MYLRTRGFITLLVSVVAGSAASPSVPGITNFAEVNQKVCRGGQPTGEGFKHLSEIGIKVVLDLREHDQRSLSEEQVVTADGMRYINVPMTGLTPPTLVEIGKILSLLEDPSADRVFVHCKRGADRTGAVIAAYRVDHDGWDNVRALREALAHGMGTLQFPRKRFIRTFQARVKVAGPATVGAGAGAGN